MTYQPLSVKQGGSTKYRTSTMPTQGINWEDLAQTMDLKFALNIVNYIPYRYGLDKRRGLSKIFEVAGANPISLLKKFTDDVWIFAYGTTVAAYDESTDVITNIKTNFSANDGFDGQRYGEYFFVCNGVDQIWRIDSALAIAVIGASPICSGLKVIGSRLYAFNLSTDSTSIQYSEIDDGTNPPFTAWTQTTAADTGGTIRFRNAGTARSVVQLGQYTVAFYDQGFAAWYTNVIDSNGTLKKTDVIQNYTEDYGGARGAIETNFGIFYINEAGLWQMVAVGATDVPMSKQQLLNSTLLGSDYFKDIDQSNVDIAYDENLKCVFVTAAKDSPFNNVVIGCKPELKNAMFTFNNWNINRFAKDGVDLYGASSVKTTAYKLFEGYDDDGLKIGTEYYQEIPLETLFHAHSLSELYAGGWLTPDDELTIAFDTYNLSGDITYNKEEYLWTGVESNLNYNEWGSAPWGDSSWGGGVDTAGMVESFGGGSPRVNNMQRLRVRITGGSKTRHILNWIATKTRQKGAIKRRNITRITT